MELYGYWDDLISQASGFNRYVSSHYYDIVSDAEARKAVKVLSSYSSGLGIASPSKLTNHIVKKYKSGRIIKQPKPSQLYKAIYYDSEGQPVAIESFDKLRSDGELNGKTKTRYFIPYGGAVWTAWFWGEKNVIPDNEHHKIVYDDKNRLKGFYTIGCGPVSHWVSAEEYDHSEIGSGIVTCIFTYYVEHLSGSSKDIPIGYKGSPAIQWKYVINVDENGKYTALTSYKNIEGEFVYNEHTDL